MTGFKHALFFYQIGKHAEKTSNTNKVSLTQNSRSKHLIGFPLITDYPTVFKKKIKISLFCGISSLVEKTYF